MKKSGKVLQVADAQQFKIWQGLYLAFFSPRFYVDVMQRWRGLGLLYLFLLILCVTLPFSLRIGVIFNQYLNEHIVEPLEALPPLYIHKGQISFPYLMPYTVVNSQKQIVAIVDTTDLIKTINQIQYPQLSWLFMQNSIEFKAPPLELFSGFSVPLQESYFKEILDENIDDVFVGKEFIKSYWVKFFIRTLCAILVIGTPLFFFHLFGFIFIGFAWLIQFYARVIFKEKIKYSQAYRLLSVSFTAPAALLFFSLAANFIIPHGGLVYPILLSVYFSFGLIAYRRANRQIVAI